MFRCLCQLSISLWHHVEKTQIAIWFFVFLRIKCRRIGPGEKTKKKRQIWTQDTYLQHDSEKVYEKLIFYLKNEGEDFYKKCVRVSFDDFEYINKRIKHRIVKVSTD